MVLPPTVVYEGGQQKFHETTDNELAADETKWYNSLPPNERSKYKRVSKSEYESLQAQKHKDRKDREKAFTEKVKQKTLKDWQTGIRSGKFDPHGTFL